MDKASPNATEISLLVDNLPEELQGREQVPAVQIGENQYRLTGSPGFAAGLASGDEIELASEEPLGYRLLKRGGNVCIQVFLRQYTAEERQRLTAMVESVGGWLDGGMDGQAGHLLIFTIPVSVGFPAMERVMAKASAEFAVDQWMYGNVYDADGVTPLHWWTNG